MRLLKSMGFSDARLASSRGKAEDKVRQGPPRAGRHPVYKRIDTCAAEFASPTAYMYSTYETPFAGQRRPRPSVSDREKVVILGGGPNRIGQGIEFDYCCCHAAFALKDAGYESIMVNCNPETVSTDYDTSDRLYFEPLTARRRAGNPDHRNRTNGNAARRHRAVRRPDPAEARRRAGRPAFPILGTSPDAIDLAEDRDRFQKLLHKLNLAQPNNGIAYSVDRPPDRHRDRLPVVVRPSYVLGGRAMQIIRDEAGLSNYLLGTVPELVPEDIKARYPNDKTGQINTLSPAPTRCCSTAT
jgi:carbamoyl-phosphate synthase large subunit